MYKILAIINGISIALMIMINSGLATGVDAMSALVIIHATGGLLILAYFLVTKTKWKSMKHIHPFYYLAGAIGVINISLNNYCFAALGASLTVGLVLFGQLLTSAIVDHFGLLGMKQRKLTAKKIMSLGIICLGIIIMIIW